MSSIRLALSALLAAACLPCPGAQARWLASWEAAIGADSTPPITGQTVRQFARISRGGPRIRVVFSNATGTKPLHVGDAHAAMAGTSPGTVDTRSDHAVTFHGLASAVVAPGASVTSDPVDLPVGDLARIGVSARFASDSPVEVGHLVAGETIFIAPGSHAGEAYMAGARKSLQGYYLSGIEVDDAAAGAVATIGDSITDGLNATVDKERRWPDRLAERITGRPTAPAAVINAGLTGNMVQTLGPATFGPPATARFERDVLSRPGVRWVILAEGINDLIAATDPAQTVQDLIAAYQDLVEAAHARNVKVFGATLLPFGGADPAYYSPAKDAGRQAVNAWIRTAGAFDGVLDFDALMRAPGNPSLLKAAYDSGDHIHPNDAGYAAMGDSVPLGLFTAGSAP